MFSLAGVDREQGVPRDEIRPGPGLAVRNTGPDESQIEIVALVGLQVVIIRPHRKEGATWPTWSRERIER